MTTPIIEVVPSGATLVNEPGRRNATGFTAHYDVVCSVCGPVASGKMYPSACREKADHLCNPRRKRQETAA
jgi:hypothetical protein